jgi:ABC-type nitrate/sulfonate/bicarbonate transport system substrate-binding protein
MRGGGRQMLPERWLKRNWLGTMAIAVALLIALTLAGTGSAQNLTPLRWGNVGLESTYYAPVIFAERKGYFHEEGIRSEQLRLSDPDLVRAVAAGSIGFGIPEVGSGIIARERGAADIRVIAGITDRYPYDLMVKSQYNSIAELKGKTLSIWSTAPGVALTLMKRVLAQGGLKDGDYNIVGGGNSGARYAALISGQIDGTIITTPHNTLAKKAGFKSLGQLHAIPALFAGVIANKTWTDRNETLMLGWLKASIRGFRYVADAKNQDEVVRVLAEEFKADPEVIRGDYRQLYHDQKFIVSWDLIPNARSMQTVLDVLAEINQIPQGQPLNRYYDLNLVRRAAAP